MLFHANDIHNRAVWNAMRLHAEIIIEGGETLTFIVKEKNYERLCRHFSNNKIIKYTSTLSLIKGVISSNEKNIFSPDIISVLLMSICKIFHQINIYFWIQGIIPEESYMRHKSLWRKSLLSLLECTAIRISTYQVLSSQYMGVFLKDKYSVDMNTITIPCTSDLTHKKLKRIPYSFVYVGGLSVWQKFDDVLQLFNRVAEIIPQASLHVATGDEDKAKMLCQKYLIEENCRKVSIQNIDDRNVMAEFLSTKQFGLLIRDNELVNNVSSPIKLAEYLSSGVNIIVSSSLTSYAPIIEECKAGIVIDTIKDIDTITDFKYSEEASLSLYHKIFSRKDLVRKYQSIL